MNAINLSWPPSELNPNSRAHWRKKVPLIKKCKDEAEFVARESGLSVEGFKEIHCHITFYPPDDRRRDVDNFLSACKSKLDGISKAIGVDDHKFILHPLMAKSVSRCGHVEVRFSDDRNN